MWDLFINLLRFGDKWGEEAKKEGGRRYTRRRYLVRDLVAQQVFKLVPLRTNLMVADALTKSLPAPAHARHRDVMIGQS
jgi:hypothetical protein